MFKAIVASLLAVFALSGCGSASREQQPLISAAKGEAEQRYSASADSCQTNGSQTWCSAPPGFSLRKQRYDAIESIRVGKVSRFNLQDTIDDATIDEIGTIEWYLDGLVVPLQGRLWAVVRPKGRRPVIGVGSLDQARQFANPESWAAYFETRVRECTQAQGCAAPAGYELRVTGDAIEITTVFDFHMATRVLAGFDRAAIAAGGVFEWYDEAVVFPMSVGRQPARHLWFAAMLDNSCTEWSRWPNEVFSHAGQAGVNCLAVFASADEARALAAGQWKMHR